MSNELFTAVSVEEQEIVAGGVFAFSGSLAQYALLATNTNGSVATPGGSGGGSTSSLSIGSLGINLSGFSI
ncbi:MAG: CTB family bacteriocin [Aulosira sp. DedQUE10]|nr:CTB family bacteriocin [Aulosira sp. DedQUE10]